MKIERIKIGHVTTPMGFWLEKPRITWVVSDSPSRRQTAAQVTVALDEAFTRIVADSGKCENLTGLGCTPDFTPEARTRYHIRIQVWGDAGDRGEGTSWFETGKGSEAWTASPLTAPSCLQDKHLLFRKEFGLEKPVGSARLYICGLGLYEAHINGRRVGSERLTPYYNDYDAWVQAQCYDVTEALRQGSNALGVHLGKGWYLGRFGCHGKSDCLYGEHMGFIAELHVRFAEGGETVLCSDKSWLCAPSYVTDSGIYDGEKVDWRLHPGAWSCPGFSSGGWTAAKRDDSFPLSRLRDRLSLPMTVRQTRPVNLLRTPKGELVLDAGQIMTGWLRFRLDIPEGRQVRLRYGELLRDGCFYRENLRSALAEYTVISGGEPVLCEPLFTYYGFRYVLVEGLEEVRPEDFTACAVYSDFEETGSFSCSEPLLNRLAENVLWGLRGNFLDVPTDCPQRDERMGWTGDAQVFCGTALYYTDTAAFYRKYLTDLQFEQARLRGGVPFTIPSKGVQGHSSAAWGDAAVIIPWEVYKHSGDPTVLERQYESMCAWLAYIHSRDEAAGGRRLWTGDFHFGDWLAMDVLDPKNRHGGTDRDFIACAYYVCAADTVARTARVLGKTEDALRYETLAEEIRAAVRREYFTPSGRLAVDTQTAHVLALRFSLCTEQQRPRTAERLGALLRESGGYLRTGFVGTPYICGVLTGNGMAKEAYTLLLNEDCPSWLYAVKLGATTVWERWNSLDASGNMSDTAMNSLNHYAYGSVMEWVFCSVAGISPLEPGFRVARLAPVMDKRLRFARAELNTAAGLYICGWRRSGDDTSWEIEAQVPFHAEAELCLPGGETRRLAAGTHRVSVPVPAE